MVRVEPTPSVVSSVWVVGGGCLLFCWWFIYLSIHIKMVLKKPRSFLFEWLIVVVAIVAWFVLFIVFFLLKYFVVSLLFLDILDF